MEASLKFVPNSLDLLGTYAKVTSGDSIAHMKGIGKANVGCISLVVASWWTMLHGLFLVWPLQESVKKIDQYLEKGNLALTHFLNSRHEVFGLCNATMFTPNLLYRYFYCDAVQTNMSVCF